MVRLLIQTIFWLPVAELAMGLIRPRRGDTTTTKHAITKPLVFNRILMLGSIGPDVKSLQQYLNTHGYIIAKTGPGSPGHETTLFGSLTKQALKKFQKDHGITPTGQLGPITTAYILAHQ